jgi:hypothetical protein
MPKPSYCPLQSVIVFNREDSPVCGLVSAQVFYPAVYLFEGSTYVRVATHEEDAAEGRGLPTLTRHVQPQRPDLVAACQEWHRRRQQLEADFELLRKGKIPAGYLQPLLFG